MDHLKLLIDTLHVKSLHNKLNILMHGNGISLFAELTFTRIHNKSTILMHK